MKIAITGKMCSGKSTVAQILSEEDERFKILSFGRKVKEVAQDLFDMRDKNRTLLVTIGTKMREIDPDVWTKYVLKQTKGLTHCIIDDLRYQNEYESLVKEGFKIIYLDIDPEIQENRIKINYPNNYEDHLKNRGHSSEQSIFNWLEGNNPLIIDSGKISIHQIILKIREFCNEE